MEKTCGNCGHFMRDTETHNMGICSVCYFEDADGIDVYRAVWKNQPCGLPHDFVLNTDTLEQRYQQLSEVALDMLESLDDTCRFCSHRECMQFGCSEAYNNAHNHFKAQLEELGVEL